MLVLLDSSCQGIKCLNQRLVSDQTIKLGTISIDAIVGELYDVCSTQGQCDTSPFDLKGQFIAPGLGGSVKSATLTVNPSGSYPTWIHNGLLDAIGAAVKAVAKCEKITRTSTCPNPMAYCPSKFLALTYRDHGPAVLILSLIQVVQPHTLSVWCRNTGESIIRLPTWGTRLRPLSGLI